jgi:hypothetical protein
MSELERMRAGSVGGLQEDTVSEFARRLKKIIKYLNQNC